MDVNDHLPVFSTAEYKATVPENALPGTTVTVLQCRDKDLPNTPKFMMSTHRAASPLYFTLHHAHSLESQGIFALDSSTGVLTVAKPLDR